MGRMIDTDELIDILGFENTQEERDENVGEIITLDDIDRIPTAYDIEKVVEQLNDKFRVVRTDEDLEWNRAMDEAITIAKGGGVDAKTDS